MLGGNKLVNSVRFKTEAVGNAGLGLYLRLSEVKDLNFRRIPGLLRERSWGILRALKFVAHGTAP